MIDFDHIMGYLSFCLQGLNKYNEKLSYKTVNNPVYRGVKISELHDIDDYEIGSIGIWPQFSSSTKDK